MSFFQTTRRHILGVSNRRKIVSHLRVYDFLKEDSFLINHRNTAAWRILRMYEYSVLKYGCIHQQTHKQTQIQNFTTIKFHSNSRGQVVTTSVPYPRGLVFKSQTNYPEGGLMLYLQVPPDTIPENSTKQGTAASFCFLSNSQTIITFNPIYILFRGAQIPGASFLWRLYILLWCLILVGPQHGICFM